MNPQEPCKCRSSSWGPIYFLGILVFGFSADELGPAQRWFAAVGWPYFAAHGAAKEATAWIQSIEQSSKP